MNEEITARLLRHQVGGGLLRIRGPVFWCEKESWVAGDHLCILLEVMRSYTTRRYDLYTCDAGDRGVGLRVLLDGRILTANVLGWNLVLINEQLTDTGGEEVSEI